MYHPYSKSNPLVRKALYEAYSRKCAYCGDLIQPKNMHVDHILATNSKNVDDIEFNQYLDELTSDGFVIDSIENYRPSCAACNLKKNNRNFSVSTLRFYHHEACEKSSKVLSIIAQYQIQDVSFDSFDPDYYYWEKIDFSHQKDISEAIAGYRLQPCHVCACPRLTQVEEIKRKLGIVDYVIVEGEPGCGKSISIYQAAFDLCKQGYIVYRYINKNAEDTIFLPQSNEKKHLIIIDDAQNLPQFSLEQILSQSQEQIKIILAFTQLGAAADHSYSEPIRITNFDAVKAIAHDYKKRKLEILPIVKKFDRFVGDGMMDTPFESRIKNAATKNTPWLFNYTLRGGWNTINEQFQAVYNHNKCGLLCAVIALFQILKMDSTIDFKWLQTYIQKFDKFIVWTEDDLNCLIKNKLVASPDDVRIVHIESAKSIIHSFHKVADESSKQMIYNILEDGYKSRLFTEQGLIWLQSVTFSSVYYLREKFFTESLLDSVFSNLEEVIDDERRGFVAYFLERMFSLCREKNGQYYFKQNEQLLAQWISTTTSKNAYAYSQLLNALNNERNDTLKDFVSKIDISLLLQNFSDSPIEDLYVWAKLLERLAYPYDNSERMRFGELLRPYLIAKSQEVTVKAVGIFYYSLSEMFYLNEALILELLTNNVDKFQGLCLEKAAEAIEVLDFHFIDLCGLSHFSSCKPTKQQRDFSKKFVNALPVTAISDFVSHSLPRDWHRIYDLGRLLYRENKKLYSRIIKNIDFDVLNKYTTPLWKKTSGDLHLLFCFIAFGDKETAKRFFMTNIEKIEELGLPYIKFLPEQAITLYKRGVKIRLFENNWNDETFFALNALHDASETEYKNILDSEFSQLASKISEFCSLDFDKDEKTLYEILAYIKETHPSVFSEVVPMLNFAKMKEEKLRMFKDDRCGRRSRKQFHEMIDILIEFSNETNIGELQSLKSLK